MFPRLHKLLEHLNLWRDTGKILKHRTSFESFIVIRRTIFGGYIVQGHNDNRLIFHYYRRRFRSFQLTDLDVPRPY